MHNKGLVPSTYHQCAKANIKGTEVTIRATRRPFTVEEDHLVDASFYTELEEDVRGLTRRMEGAWVPSIRERMGPLNE